MTTQWSRFLQTLSSPVMLLRLIPLARDTVALRFVGDALGGWVWLWPRPGPAARRVCGDARRVGEGQSIASGWVGSVASGHFENRHSRGIEA